MIQHLFDEQGLDQGGGGQGLLLPNPAPDRVIRVEGQLAPSWTRFRKLVSSISTVEGRSPPSLNHRGTNTLQKWPALQSVTALLQTTVTPLSY